MHNPYIDNMQPEAVEYLSLNEAISLCGISDYEAGELVDYGAIRFHHTVNEQGFLSCEHLHTLQTACKQRRDYDLDLFAIVISVAYLETISALEKVGGTDQLQIQRFKRRKLLLKDQISKLEDRLTPDIIA